MYAAWASKEFQSTHPRGVRPGRRRLSFYSGIFQSTHPRGVRQRLTAATTYTYEISIHAPAWGATYPSHFIHITHYISIHAPAWGATATLERCPLRGVHFNPRTRVGCDWPSMPAVGPRRIFQSTHPRGVRLQRVFFGLFSGVFQSTHPRGVRLGIATAKKRTGEDFNPRTRVGCDSCTMALIAKSARISIHAPAWGATCANGLAPFT